MEEDKTSEKSENKSAFLIGIIYICNPIIKTTLKIELTIKIPGCDNLVVNWEKVCGNSLSPMPGLNASLTTGKFINVPIITDGNFDIGDPRMAINPQEINVPAMVSQNSVTIGTNKAEITFWINPNMDNK